jgi:hypothetical protein
MTATPIVSAADMHSEDTARPTGWDSQERPSERGEYERQRDYDERRLHERNALQQTIAAQLKQVGMAIRFRIPLLAAPPLVGLALLAVVISGVASDAVLRSPAATCTALIVSAALILVPPLLLAHAPEQYAAHLTDVQGRLTELVGPPPNS